MHHRVITSLKAFRTNAARAAERAVEPTMMFPVMAVLLLAIIWSTAYHFIQIEHDSAIARAADSSTALLETYEAQMIRNLATIGQALRTTKYAYELGKTDATLSELTANALLPPSMLFSVGVADANGKMIASTRPQELGRNLPRDAVPEYLQRDSEATFVSAPTRLVADDAPRLYFSRRLNRPDGSFNGVVTVSVEPAYFTSGYDRARLGDNGVLGLVDAGGHFLVKRSADTVSWGEAAGFKSLASEPGLQNPPPVISHWDGISRHLRSRPLPGIALDVLVGLSAQEQLAVFETERRSYYVKAAVGSAFLLALLGILGRQSWQLSATRQRSRMIQQTYYAASNASLDGFFVLQYVRDLQGAIVDFIIRDANLAGLKLFGQTKERLIGKSLCEAMPQCRSNGILAELQLVATNQSADESEWENHDPSIRAGWLQRQFVAVDDGIVAILRDITERKRAEILHVEQARLLELIATGMPLPQVLDQILQLIGSQLPAVMGSVYLTSSDGQSLHLGASIALPETYLEAARVVPIADIGACGTAAYRRETVIATDIGEDPLWSQCSQYAIAHGLHACWSTPIMSQQQVLGTFAMYYRSTHHPNRAEIALVAFATRLAGIAIERQQTEDRIGHMAHHDALTGLPNRTLLDDRIRQAVLHAQRYDRRMTVLFIDLDNFKVINDTLGHNAGDALLIAVAQRMTACVRSTDTVIRLGGDEFVIVLSDQLKGLDALTQPLQKIHRAISQPVTLLGKQIDVTCSMGMATYPGDGTDPEELLTNADAAMYRAKQMGRNNFQFYTAELHQAMHEKIQLQEGLRTAHAEQQFFLAYQPQVDLQTGKIVALEALIRWHHPVLGIVPPARFIPLAEESRLIVQIGEWVLHTACQQNRAWQRAGLSPCVVAVNVSARQFREPGLLAAVANALGQSGLDAQYLELELTESLIMQDPEQAIGIMKELRDMGVRLSIDDFGTGYSSLSALQRFPIARLKLDGSFIQSLGASEDSRTITKAMISLGHQLDLRVVAECVETAVQRQFLQTYGCDEMQGYLFSKPVSPEQISVLLSAEAHVDSVSHVSSHLH